MEKYISDGLNSLLAQTFQNFEVIAVNDGSTDASLAVVESYVEKFGGRLRLVKLKRHSGGATEPRNMGLSLSRGEYVYFMDSDDVVIPTGLEELYTLAKEYNAEVVHCEKFYGIPDEFFYDVNYVKKLKLDSSKVFIKEPTWLTQDLEKRTVEFCQRWLLWCVGCILIRRDFVIENQLRFVGVVMDDMLFTICEICSAERYLVVPNVIYMHRVRPDSLLWQDSDKAEKFIHSRMTMLKEGISYLDKYLGDREAFSQRPDLKYAMFNLFAQKFLGHFNKIYVKVPVPALDELLRKEFSNGDNVALNSFIFNMLNIYHLQMYKNQQQFQQFATQAQQRMAELESELKRKEL